MKQILFLLITVFSLASCSYTSGSGNIITENRSVRDFTGLSVGGDFDVEVKIGPVTEVKVEADDNIMRHVETVVSGNTLKIRIKDLHNYGDVHMKVYITTPSLLKVSASASARVDVKDELKASEKLSFNASSSGNIHADVDAPDVEADASSGAEVRLTGKTRTYNAQASSGASVKSYDLLSENTIVQVSSGASARVHASVSLNAQASSGGSVSYHGDATVTKSESSGGSVSKKD
ncbi:MAG: DUF2807 domain-containing protein [Chitinophagaceae bacterium]|nr:DUF2807 domain-containing protein [Chitinophagaceae bacterium]